MRLPDDCHKMFYKNVLERNQEKKEKQAQFFRWLFNGVVPLLVISFVLLFLVIFNMTLSLPQVIHHIK